MNYAKVNLFDIANGEGIRVSLFVSGCNFHCPQCFNQDAQDFSFGAPFTSSIKKAIINRINLPFIDGLTLIGGDPLCQRNEDIKELIELCKEVKKLDKTIWIWSGYTWEEIFDTNDFDDIKQQLVGNCDVWVDGRFEINKKDLSLAWRGSSNQRIIDVQKSLKKKQVVLYEYE